ncbi:MAG: NUDIX hydrolase [Candidatus Latescibacteria bacterium]|jgi:nudix-type nucleoside diphosphatase (YffH/AdpP family)|nr:NUDIX hydrolase [Candidatus Latescibacterota bacterium]MBT4139894.1 NUDIX hydrolase [Candidatus Latescibacterota bacterium]
MQVEIRSIETPYQFTLPNGHVLFKIEEATLSHETFKGGMTPEITRINFERGDGVGVLLYAEEKDEVVLVEQFRYPVYASRSINDDCPTGWLLEIVAGIKDGEGHRVARRELLEETGFELTKDLEHLTTFYLSPGGSSEQMELYLAHVKKADGIQPHTGLQSETEDIRTHTLPFSQALQMIKDGRIRDAKTMIALMLLRDQRKTA